MPVALCPFSQVLFYLLRLEPFTKLGRALQARSSSCCACGVCTRDSCKNQCSVGGACCGAVPACCLSWSAVLVAAGVYDGKAEWLSYGSLLAARMSLPLTALSKSMHWPEPMDRHRPTMQGGRFDHADRLFHSVAATWQNVLDNTAGGFCRLLCSCRVLAAAPMAC